VDLGHAAGADIGCSDPVSLTGPVVFFNTFSFLAGIAEATG
jgi:hypothetical protein